MVVYARFHMRMFLFLFLAVLYGCVPYNEPASEWAIFGQEEAARQKAMIDSIRVREERERARLDSIKWGWALTATDLRSAGDPDSVVIARVKNGEAMALLEHQGEWRRVMVHDSVTGYIRAEEVDTIPRPRDRVFLEEVQQEHGNFGWDVVTDVAMCTDGSLWIFVSKDWDNVSWWDQAAFAVIWREVWGDVMLRMATTYDQRVVTGPAGIRASVVVINRCGFKILSAYYDWSLQDYIAEPLEEPFPCTE